MTNTSHNYRQLNTMITKMKLPKIYLILLLLPFLQNYTYAKSVIIELTLSSKINSEDQYVYLFSLLGNETTIEDSCLVLKNQQKIIIEKEIINDDEKFYWLTFSKTGPNQIFLLLTPGEKIQLYIDEDTPFFPEAIGSKATLEWYQFGLRSQKIRLKMDSLINSTLNTNDSLQIAQISDSINYYKRYLAIDHNLEFLNTTECARNYVDILTRKENLLAQNVVDSLVTVMKNRFPNNQRVIDYPNTRKFPPASSAGKSAYNKFEEILKFKSDYINITKTTPITEVKTDNIKPLTLGSKVENISLVSTNGKIVSLYDLNTPYVLIDFWASWCGPCRRETANILKIHNKLKNDLTVYAITIDQDDNAWKEAIWLDKSSELTHVTINNSENKTAILKLFDVQRIPMSFLIGKDRKIISVNLRGEALEEKMKELMGK